MSLRQKLKVPAILTDIDGVVYRGTNVIGKSHQVVTKLLKPYPIKQTQTRVPFACLTNGGGILEHDRADYFNNIVFGKQKNQDQPLLTGEQMILCHTPIKDLKQQYEDKFILVGGVGNIIEICQKYGFKKALHVEEVFALKPELSNLTRKQFPPQRLQKALDSVLQRFGNIKPEEIQFSAVMLLSDADWFELNLQIMSDVILSTDGSIGGPRRTQPDQKQKVKFYATNPDLLYADVFHHSRMSSQYPLILAIDSFMKHAHGLPLEVIQYGKPSNLTFEYAKSILDQQAKDFDVEIDKYYMIGDNPTGDIYGANLMGWESVLVKTGVYKNGDYIKHEHKPKHTVEDMSEALDLIMSSY